jgi:hypothetical protein
VSQVPVDRAGLGSFLVERLTEELAQLWSRDQERGERPDRPGLAAQVAILDEQLATLRAGRLPPSFLVRIMLWGYGSHPDYQPGWAALVETDHDSLGTPR